jgi:hypothetical protein
MCGQKHVLNYEHKRVLTLDISLNWQQIIVELNKLDNNKSLLRAELIKSNFLCDNIFEAKTK